MEIYSLTGSIAIRASGLPIENLGVTPDYVYEITSADLQNNYTDFKKSLLNILKDL
jgi:C-terminal processing protease CtpA/Prc